MISQRFYPEAFRINDICKELVKEGHRVTVLTGLPNYPSGNIPKEYRRNRKHRDSYEGAEVIRTWEVGRRPGKLGLAVNYGSLALSSSWEALWMKKGYDVIFVYQPSPVFSLIPAWIIKKRSGIPILLYCCDLWPESLKAYEVGERQMLYRIMRRVSGFLYRQCDRIAVTSMPFVEYLQRVHQLKIEMLYLPQHAEETYLEMDLSHLEGEEVQLLFCGNVGKAQDMPCLLHGIAGIEKGLMFHVHIVGDGSELEASRRLAKELKIQDKVTFHGRYPSERLPDFYRMADGCLLTLTGKSFIGMTMPGKLQEYMAAGKPVLAATDGAAKGVIEESGCGVCVGAGDWEGYGKILSRFIEDVEGYKGCGERGRRYFRENFTKGLFMGKLVGSFEEISVMKQLMHD